jgi:enoyl-CoA hydratase/carnithine racemase
VPVIRTGNGAAEGGMSELIAVPVASEGLRYEKRDHIAYLTLDRPERGNSLHPAMHTLIRKIWEDVKRDPDVRAVIMTGTGDQHFCTGADLGVIADNGRVSQGPGPVNDEVFWSPRQNQVWKPVICAVNGACAGGGLHFVADADIVLAAPEAYFVDPHVNVGMVGGLESTSLAYRLPIGAVLRMTLMGRAYRMSAQRAFELGLVDEVIARGKLLSTATEIATAIVANSPTAVSLSKQAIWASREMSYQQALEYGWALIRMHWNHPDFREGPAAFSEGRVPEWAPLNGRGGGERMTEGPSSTPARNG